MFFLFACFLSLAQLCRVLRIMNFSKKKQTNPGPSHVGLNMQICLHVVFVFWFCVAGRFKKKERNYQKRVGCRWCWVHFGRPVPSCLQLWIMALSVVRWDPKALDVSDVVSHHFFSLKRVMMCSSLRFFSLLHFVRHVLFKGFLDSTGLTVKMGNLAWVWLVKLNSAFQKKW